MERVGWPLQKLLCKTSINLLYAKYVFGFEVWIIYQSSISSLSFNYVQNVYCVQSYNFTTRQLAGIKTDGLKKSFLYVNNCLANASK